MKLQNIMACAHQRPLCSNLLFTAQQKLSKAPCVFDLAEHRFHNCLPGGVDGLPGFGLQFSSHPILSIGASRQWPTRTRPRSLVVFVAGHRQVGIHTSHFGSRNAGLRRVAAVGQYLLRLLPRLLLHHLDHGQKLLLVVARLRQALANNEL